MTGPETAFPNLVAGGYALTSPATFGYNCMAWAAGDVGNWWWPDPARTDYWPEGVPRAETLDAFAAAFATLGYSAAADSGLRTGAEKVAFYSLGGKPTHAARQLPAGGRASSAAARTSNTTSPASKAIFTAPWC